MTVRRALVFVLLSVVCGGGTAACSGGGGDGDAGAEADGTHLDDAPDGGPDDEPAEVDAAPFCADHADGTSCDDGDPCSEDDRCAAGACAGRPRTCEDLNPCTDDLCDPATGDCIAPWNTAPCDDGNSCTVGDTCGGGECRSGVPRDCSELSDDCNYGECMPLTGECQRLPLADGRACDDADACSTGETCLAGICGGGTVRDCSHLDDACNSGVCDPAGGECAARPRADGTLCDDGAACTSDDACRAGVCAGVLPDADGDGYGALGCAAGDDCDDARAEVNPGAEEGPTGRASCFDGLDNDCDGATDLSAAACEGLDWANVDRPLVLAVDVGVRTPLIFGRAFEPGATGLDGPLRTLWAEVGMGPSRSDPTENAAWRWFHADYWGRGGTGNTDDVFAGRITPPSGGTFSVAYRYSLDAGRTWLYADADGNGAAAPANGIQLDRLGTLVVVMNDHLLLTEIVVTPTEREYVELHNPTASDVALDTYFLYDAADPATTWRYWDLPVGAPWPTVRGYDFVAAFPAGATLPPGGRVVVAMGSAQTFAAQYGTYPSFELRPGVPDEAAVPNMRPAFPGSIGGSAAGVLANTAETVVLFRWDGATDLVADVDIFQWGTTVEAVDKTGVSRDGPDADTVADAYRADLPVASQHVFGSGHAPGGSFERVDLAEGSEVRLDGNGVTGHDETGEDYGATWRTAAAATPES